MTAGLEIVVRLRTVTQNVNDAIEVERAVVKALQTAYSDVTFSIEEVAIKGQNGV